MEKMPDGSSSYVRGRTVGDKLRTLNNVYDRLREMEYDSDKAVDMNRGSGKDKKAFDKSVERRDNIRKARAANSKDFVTRAKRSLASLDRDVRSMDKRLSAIKRGK